MADPISPFTPTMQQQLEQLLQSQVDRSARTTPIHQAAMAMASRMAPGYAQSAMTAPTASAAPRVGGSPIIPSTSSSVGPGLGTTAAAAFAAALLKDKGNNPLLSALKKLLGIGGGGGGGGASDLAGGTGGFDQIDNSSWLPSWDPFSGNGQPGGFPSDPSGDSGTGPGMQAFYDWLASQGADGGGGTAEKPFGLEPDERWGG